MPESGYNSMHQPLQHFDFLFTSCSSTGNKIAIECFKPHYNRYRLVNSVTMSFCFCANKNVTTKSQLSPEQDNQHFVHLYTAGADTGFSVGGAPTPRGAPTYKFDGFSQKLHEIKKILVCRGGRAGGAPLGSATASI